MAQKEEEKTRLLEEVTVNKTKLLEVLKKNREKHHKAFKAAQKGYQLAAIADIEVMLAEAMGGKEIRRYVEPSEPSDYTEEYDCIITMAEMSLATEITLTHREFQQYILDKWTWSSGFSSSCSSYSSSTTAKKAKKGTMGFVKQTRSSLSKK